MVSVQTMMIFLLLKTVQSEPFANIDIPPTREEIENLMQQYPGHPGLTAALNSTELNRSPNNASVLVLGLDGVGKSATIQSIFKIPLSYNDNDASTIREHSIHIPLPHLGITNAYIKILDTPGFVQGNTAEQDAAILTTIQKYLNSSEGLNGRFPTSILIISRFDDNEAGVHYSKFVQMLKQVEKLKNYFGPSDFSSNSSIIFVFTHFLSSTFSESRRPAAKLNSFQTIIKNFTNFPFPIVVTVAENRYDDYELPKQDGYYKLPNKELFPRNIISKMIDSAKGIGDSVGQSIILQEILKQPDVIRNSTQKTFLVENRTHRDNSYYDISSESDCMQKMELYDALHKECLELDSNLPNSFCSALETVLLGSKNPNITNLVQIRHMESKKLSILIAPPFRTAATLTPHHTTGGPGNTELPNIVATETIRGSIAVEADHLEKVPLSCPTPKSCTTTPPAPIWQYQRICPTTTAAPIKPATSKATKPFEIFSRRFDNLNNYVGQGYHMLHDVILETSPLELKLNVSNNGFPASGAFKINQLDRACFIGRVKQFQNYRQYAIERMTAALPIVYQTTDAFQGSIKPGYNVISLEGRRTIRVLKEKRSHRVSLQEPYEYNRYFMQDADNLPYYNYRECQSMGAWKRFFDKYGTHVVTSAYLGTAKEEILLGFSVQKWKRDNLHYNQALCLPSPDLSLDQLANEMFTPLRTGMRIEMIGKVLGLRNPSQQVDALSALMDLVDNKLIEC